MVTELTGTVSVVTGGTSGIGLATAMALLTKGSNVVINARAEKADLFDKLCALGAPSGARCVFAAGDASAPETSQKVVSAALDAFGRVDAVVHSAGGPAAGTILDLSPERWMEAFAVHVHSAFHLFRAAHGPLSARGRLGHLFYRRQPHFVAAPEPSPIRSSRPPSSSLPAHWRAIMRPKTSASIALRPALSARLFTMR